MASRTLKLDGNLLKLASESLELEISTAVDVKVPLGWDFEEDKILEALISGNIWAARGRKCRVDVDISFNGKSLDDTSRISLLEYLGYNLRDTYVGFFWLASLLFY